MAHESPKDIFENAPRGRLTNLGKISRSKFQRMSQYCVKMLNRVSYEQYQQRSRFVLFYAINNPNMYYKLVNLLKKVLLLIIQ